MHYDYDNDKKQDTKSVLKTKMLVTCQRFGSLLLYGLVWQYSTNQNQYNKGRFKVIIFLQAAEFSG
jgi:hypothetical protein